MKLKRLFISLFAFLGALALSMVFTFTKIDAARLELNVENPDNYQSSVVINIDCVEFTNVVSSIRFASGEYEASNFENSSFGLLVNGSKATISTNGIYTFFAKSSNNESALSIIEISNIDCYEDKVKLTQRTLNDNSGNVIMDIEFLNNESPIKLMKYMEGRRKKSDFKDFGTILTKEETGNYTYITFSSSGSFTLYIEDECGNASITEFEIENTNIVRGKNSVSISAAKHVTYDIKKSGNQYYLEMPKKQEEISYNQGDVVVFTLYDEESGNFNVISSGTYYIYMDNDNVERLEKDCIRIIIDDKVISDNNLTVGDSVVAQFMSRKEAKDLGIQISYFNNKVLIIAGVVIIAILIVFFVHRSRIKKTKMYDHD